jgi:hypothetical protein|uniref:Uncharacterized protein n=1 Tax=viral metagenome TaxID=1070528 RepID=A0A6C0CLK9_9ZZZZ|tara:strand:- start:5286 stop:5471 length:186 start_codon:yes stop_codon:yes gene_type:complete
MFTPIGNIIAIMSIIFAPVYVIDKYLPKKPEPITPKNEEFNKPFVFTGRNKYSPNFSKNHP